MGVIADIDGPAAEGEHAWVFRALHSQRLDVCMCVLLGISSYHNAVCRSVCVPLLYVALIITAAPHVLKFVYF